MKKLLVIALSCLMVFMALTPANVGATNVYELTTKESLTIEFEDHIPEGREAYLLTSADASGGEMVGSGWGELEFNSFTIPFTVTEEGYYNMEFVESRGIAGDGYSRIDGMITNEANDTASPVHGFNMNFYPQKDPDFVEKEYYVTTSTGLEGGFGNTMIKQKYTNLLLEEGTYNVYFYIHGVGDHTNFALDYFKFTPVGIIESPDYELTQSEALTVEFEDNVPVGKEAYIIKSNDANGGKMVGSGWGGTDFVNFTIPVTIKDAGYYDIEFVESKYEAGSFSRIDGVINDENNENLVQGFNISAYPNLDPDFQSKVYDGFPENYMIKQKYNKVYLNAGKVNIRFDIGLVGDHTHFALDYFKFTPVIETVYPTGSTCIEFEKYAPAGKEAYILNSDDASGGKFLGSGWGEADFTRITVPVIIKESGYFDIEFVESKYEAGSFSRIDGVINDANNENLVQGFNISAYPNLDPDYVSKEYIVKNAEGAVVGGFGNMMIKQKYTKIHLEAGKYTICFDIGSVGDHTNFALDYFKFTPEIETVSAIGPTYIEFEDYVPQDKRADYVVNSAEANGGKMARHEWGAADFNNITIPVTIKEAGYYDVEFVENKFIAGDGYSRIDGCIKDENNEEVLHAFNNNAYPQLDTEFGEKQYTGYSNKMIKQKFTKVYFEAGKINISFDIGLVGDHTNFALDYIKFSTHDEITVDGDNVSVSIAPNTALTGKVIVAFYDGEKLAYFKPYDVVAGSKIETTIPVTEEFDSVKVYVWDFFNLHPISNERIFNVTNKTA